METLPQSGVDALPGLGAAFGSMMVFGLLFYAYFCLMLMLIAKKNGIENAWLAWVPILNILIMCQLARRPGWWLLLMLVPLVNFIVMVVLWMDIAETCGKQRWVGLLIIIPLIGFLVPAYLAFSGAGTAKPSPRKPQEAQPQAATSCPSCGQAIEQGDTFCGSCGQPVAVVSQTQVGTSKSSPVLIYGAAAVAIVVVLGIVGLFGFKMLARQASKLTSAPVSQDPIANPQVPTQPTDAPPSYGSLNEAVEGRRAPQPPDGTVDVEAREAPRSSRYGEEPRIAESDHYAAGPDPGVQSSTVDLGGGFEASELQVPSYPQNDGDSMGDADELIAATFEGDLDAIMSLIARGTDPNARDESGMTAMIVAVLSGNPDAVGILASSGADVNASDSEGRTPLHFAIDPYITDILLTSGADPNVRDRQGITPLMEAADAGETATVEMLLDYGADPNVRDASGRTAKSIAGNNGFDDIVQLLD